ncbi:MAG: hypothetical protein JO244_07395, partial [Solirubrobacterales bacterium]|nr:hypothetical protein [Solirubrobacterales bacterium]
MNKLYLLVLVAIPGAAASVLPSFAAGDSPPASASFSAVDFAWNASGGGNQVTIAQGGTVSFGYPGGASRHNVDFSGGAFPTSCSQTAGASSGAVPPLPNQPTAPGWTGSCTFSTPGTYTFHCDLHPFMTGTIVVEAPGETTTTPAPPPGTSPGSSTSSTGSPSPGGPASSPGGPPGGFSVKLNRSQRGHAIAG